ncbi:MAG TPA: vWA domain-containing protein [Gaiellaceae bacterium]|nr:vWA domain-containing protein [Gaiellaceae bacterium]
MRLTLEAPWAALLGIAAAAPLLAACVRERRHTAARRALGLAPPRAVARAVGLVSGAAAVLLLALAAAHPTLTRSRPLLARPDAQAYVVLDTSRSMLARERPGRPTRFQRAVSLALRIRDALGSVPVGAASFTDRPLPHLLPTPDRRAFATVVRRAIGVNRPPPSLRSQRATDLAALEQLAIMRWFLPSAERRAVVLLSDGETTPFDPQRLRRVLASAHVTLVVVRVSRAHERVFLANGQPDPGYAPSRDGEPALDALGVVSEAHAGDAAARARAALGSGPVRVVGRDTSRLDLARLCALLALVPLGATAWRARVALPRRQALGACCARLARVAGRGAAWLAR